MPIVESRLRRRFTDATSALPPAALLAGPELEPERKIARPRKSLMRDIRKELGRGEKNRA
jgi:hypothetical protein